MDLLISPNFYRSCCRQNDFFRLLVCVLLLMPAEGKVPKEPGISRNSLQDFNGCVWEQNGSVINLSGLGNTNGTARFQDVKGIVDMWWYSYNPCFPFNEGTCINAAVCQLNSPPPNQFFQAGDPSPVTLITDASSGLPAIQYTNTDVRTGLLRTSTVALMCDPTAATPRFDASGDTSNLDYHFKLTTVCACPNGCGHAEVSISISVGAILDIILLIVVVLYLLGGVIFMKAVRHANGREIIPNYTFWSSFPGLVKDGFFFVIYQIRGRKTGYVKM